MVNYRRSANIAHDMTAGAAMMAEHAAAALDGDADDLDAVPLVDADGGSSPSPDRGGGFQMA